MSESPLVWLCLNVNTVISHKMAWPLSWSWPRLQIFSCFPFPGVSSVPVSLSLCFLSFLSLYILNSFPCLLSSRLGPSHLRGEAKRRGVVLKIHQLYTTWGAASTSARCFVTAFHCVLWSVSDEHNSVYENKHKHRHKYISTYNSIHNVAL